jgi:hypothetical protein
MAQYNGQAVIPVSLVAKDYFPHLGVDKLIRKISLGQINLPLVRIDVGSQKSARGVHLQDLATYIDAKRTVAQLEAFKLYDSRI